MNTTFLTWLAVAAVVGGALLLFLGMPAGDQAAPLVLETVAAESDAAVEEYWEPITPVATTPAPVRYVSTRSQPAQPCSTCGAAQVAQTIPVRVQQPAAQPCSTCGVAHSAPAASVHAQQSYPQRCGTCGVVQSAPTGSVRGQPSYPQRCGTCGAAQSAPVAPAYVQQPAAASCSRVASPCGALPCSGLPTYCGTPCGNTCPLDRPGINRNMDLCLDECTFVQLHSTVPYPICSDVRFEWTTSKGSFLDPTSSDPVYYVPTTHFPDGEDVWVVLTITDGSGAQYTDQMKLHVNNLR